MADRPFTQLEVRLSDGTKIFPKKYSGMTEAWDDFLAAQAKYGAANVRPIVYSPLVDVKNCSPRLRRS